MFSIIVIYTSQFFSELAIYKFQNKFIEVLASLYGTSLFHTNEKHKYIFR